MTTDQFEEEAMIAKFEELGALLNGHFVLTGRPDDSANRRHSNAYVNKDVLSSHPTEVDEIAIGLVDSNWEWLSRVDIVAVPAVGAIVLGAMMANEAVCRFAYAESEDEKMVFKRGFSSLIKSGTKVAIVEDIVTSSSTLKKMVAAVTSLGGEVVGVVILWRRGPVDLPSAIKVVSLVSKEYPVWIAEDCEVCKQRIPPSTEVGHGLEFLDEFGSDPANWPANKSH